MTSDDYGVPFLTPLIDLAQLPAIVHELFPLSSIDRFSRLPSYMDLNFKFDAKFENASVESQFVLKILNWTDSKHLGNIEGQNDLMTFLHDQGLPVSAPLKSRMGQRTVLRGFDHPDYRERDSPPKYAVRIFPFLPGRLLKVLAPQPDVYFQVGKFAGMLTKCLEKFPSNRALQERVDRWDLAHLSKSWQFLDPLKTTDPEKWRKLSRILDEFESDIYPLLVTLPKAYIHGDLSDSNLIMDDRDVAGLLDFGDAVYSYRVCEIGIAIAKILLREDGDKISLSASWLAGFRTRYPVSENELSLIFPLALGRLAQIYILTRAQVEKLTSENDYLQQLIQPAWDAICQLETITKKTVMKKWNIRL